MLVDQLLPGSLVLFGANGRFHTALVAISGELGPDSNVQSMLRCPRGGPMMLHVELNLAAKHAVEWRPAC